MEILTVKNFRDIHGYVSYDGMKMKPNMIFRGGALDQLTDDEQNYFVHHLNIKHVLDFRDLKESLMAPDRICNSLCYERIGALKVSNHEKSGFDFGTLLQGEMTKEKCDYLIDYIKEGYLNMAFHNEAYVRLFDLLLENDGCVYFHCTAGKDRTGVAGFLIMIALGMSEEDAIEEYLLSNIYLKKSMDDLFEKLQIPTSLKELCKPLLLVQREWIELTIASIKEKYNDYDTFLLEEYNLTKEKRERLKQIYCE